MHIYRERERERLSVTKVVEHSISPSNALDIYKNKCTDISSLSEAKGVLDCLKKIFMKEIHSETKKPLMTENLWTEYMKEAENQFMNEIKEHTL